MEIAAKQLQKMNLSKNTIRRLSDQLKKNLNLPQGKCLQGNNEPEQLQPLSLESLALHLNNLRSLMKNRMRIRELLTNQEISDLEIKYLRNQLIWNNLVTEQQLYSQSQSNLTSNEQKMIIQSLEIIQEQANTPNNIQSNQNLQKRVQKLENILTNKHKQNTNHKKC